MNEHNHAAVGVLIGLSSAIGPVAAGQDLTSPRIVSIDPQPALGVVDQIGLEQVRIGFDEPVTVPLDAVEVWSVAAGSVEGI